MYAHMQDGSGWLGTVGSLGALAVSSWTLRADLGSFFQGALR